MLAIATPRIYVHSPQAVETEGLCSTCQSGSSLTTYTSSSASFTSKKKPGDVLRIVQLNADALHGNPSLAVKPFDEWVPEYRANIRAGPMYDEGDAETGTQLIGKGRALHGEGLHDAMLQVSRYLQHTRHEWAGAFEQEAIHLHIFTLASQGDELLWVSHYAKVRFFTRTDREDLYVAAIQHFLRVVTDAVDSIRLAACKLVPAKYGHCEDILTANLASSMQQVRAMDIAELDTKLVTVVREHWLVWLGLQGMG
ncbi:hypothetical protein WJX77_008155 [Trebouxia sp. C0004]